MSMLVAWIVYPLVLLAICVGLGLLVDIVCGRRLSGTLVPPAGLGALILIAQFTTLSDTTAELTVPVLLALALIGVVLSIPWRFGRPDPWPIGVALAVFAVFSAPVVLSGDPTFGGYIKLDDTATWLAMTDRVMDHGRSLAGLEPSSYLPTLEFNLADGYPIGVFLPFGAAQKLVGGDLAWVFQPYMSFLGAMLSLGLWEIFGSALRRPGLRALATFVAAQPALLFGYSLWGGIKEMGAAVFIALAAAVAPAAVQLNGSPRDAVPLVVATAALVGVVSLGGLVWVTPMLLAIAVLAWRRFGTRKAAIRALSFALPVAVLVIPVVSAGLIPPTSSPLTDPNAEGNLRGPLNALQVLGIWPNGDFRFDPDATVASVILIAIGIGTALAGLWLSWAKRNTAVLLYASSLVACAAIVLIGSPWAEGKALATASPVALSLAMLGAILALRADRLTGALLIAAVAGGVLWSNALAYRDVWLAPYDNLRELQQIGERFAGDGPALMTEYNPYGARYFLRTLDGEALSELRNRTVPKNNGKEVVQGYSADTDELDFSSLFIYQTLVLRRSPVRSRPPSAYRLVWSGDRYQVWQRPVAPVVTPLKRLPLGGPLEPSAIPNCSEVGGPALNTPGSRLLAARHAPVYDATAGSLRLPRDGTYVAWLKTETGSAGSMGGRVALTIDGEPVGEMRNVLENDGSFVNFDPQRLTKGYHQVKLQFPGADLHPGSGVQHGGLRLLFAPVSNERGELISVPANEANRLCGKRWDWIETIAPG